MLWEWKKAGPRNPTPEEGTSTLVGAQIACLPAGLPDSVVGLEDSAKAP